MYSETKFSIDPTKDIEFPKNPDCKNSSLLAKSRFYKVLPKVSDFYNGDLSRNSSFFVGYN